MVRNIGLWVRDFEHRALYQRPSKKFRRTIASMLDTAQFDNALQLCEELDQKGIACIPDYFVDKLELLRREFESAIEKYSVSRGTTAAEDGHVDIGHYSISNEFIRESPTIAAAALDRWLTMIAAYYWGKPVFLAQAGGTRLEPRDIETDYRAMQWHHDTKHKQLKIFILLTDVKEGQQSTRYIPGSHKIWHSSLDHGRRTREFIGQYADPVQATGKAGTVWLLDTNGFHRGTRNNTTRRDVIVFNYTAGRYLFPIKFPETCLVHRAYFWLRTSNLHG